LMLVMPLTSSAATPETAISMVPHGKLVDQTGRDFVIKTKAGTKIGIEFKRSGLFEEAKGLNLNKGDELEPGEGLLSLSSAAQKLVKKGIKPQGYWMLDKDETHGWVYEFENTIINAKTGEIINGSEIFPVKSPSLSSAEAE
jgi:hypothetical protein